jgi:hypothetical protein
MSETNGTTRRSALGRVALIAAGALGVGYAAREATDGSETAAPTRRGRKLVVYGRDMKLHSPNRVPGELPPAGDRATPQGRLVDRRERALGSFSSASLPAAAALELHTFDLADGQIFGVGAGAADEATYAVIGGTGRYAGARGSYLARHTPREGTAEFTLNLDNLEA